MSSMVAALCMGLLLGALFGVLVGGIEKTLIEMGTDKPRPRNRPKKDRAMKHPAFLVENPDGYRAVVLNDRTKAELMAAQNHGTVEPLVRQRDVNQLVQAHESGMAFLRAQIGLRDTP